MVNLVLSLLVKETKTLEAAGAPKVTGNGIEEPGNSETCGGRMNDGSSVTVSGVVCARPPLAPCTVAVKTPAGALAEASRVSVEELAVTIGGEKEAVTPAGSPLAVRLTDPVNPFNELTVMLKPADPLGGKTTAVGEADSVKSGAETVRLKVAVCVKLPLAAWMRIE